LTIISLVYFYIAYGNDIEYRYEIAAISINWTALIIGGVLLCILFRRGARHGGPEAA
jgi:hypothetical protein